MLPLFTVPRLHLASGNSEIKTAMSIVGEVSLAIDGAIIVGKIISEAVSFPSNCRELGARCKVVQTILETNKFSTTDVPGLVELNSRLKKCELYLTSCIERRFVRNPFFEVTFHRRIEKHTAHLDAWILLTTFSLVVLSHKPQPLIYLGSHGSPSRRGRGFILCNPG